MDSPVTFRKSRDKHRNQTVNLAIESSSEDGRSAAISTSA